MSRRRTVSRGATALLLVMVGTAAMAQQEPAADASPRDDARIVCKPEAKLGTKIARRVCRTKGEWRKLEEETSAASRGFMDQQSEHGSRQSGVGPSQPGGT